MNKFNHEDFQSYISGVKIDIFLTCSSFEDRCFVTINLLKNFNIQQFCIFYNENECNEITDNSILLKEIVNSKGSLYILNSKDPIANYNVIQSFFQAIFKKIVKPNILVDSTTFTHETLLIFLRILAINKALLGNLYFSYVGAGDYSINSKNDQEKWLSKGISSVRTILGYSGFTDPTKKNHLLILFGFESERTKKLIEVYEYDFVTLGFGDEAIQENHLKINYERHHKLLEEYSYAKEYSFSLIDPFKTKNQILAYLNQPIYKDLNTVIAPLNNKISTLGVGLAAIENENIQLAYAQANTYNIHGYSTPNDDIYLYKFTFD